MRYSQFPRRWDSKCSLECKSKSSMVMTGLFLKGSFEKRPGFWPSRISICISTSISSLIFSGTGCSAADWVTSHTNKLRHTHTYKRVAPHMQKSHDTHKGVSNELVYVCKYVNIRACVCVYENIYIWICINMNINITYRHTYTYMYRHKYTYMYMYIYIYIWIYIYK